MANSQLALSTFTKHSAAPSNKPLQRAWQRCADIDRGRIAKSEASSTAVQGCATPLNADPLGGVVGDYQSI